VLLPNLRGSEAYPFSCILQWHFLIHQQQGPLVAFASFSLRKEVIPGDCLSMTTILFPRNIFSHFLCQSKCLMTVAGFLLFAVVDEKTYRFALFLVNR
jgi:hypothetical protein